jgi:hypothetical protein
VVPEPLRPKISIGSSKRLQSSVSHSIRKTSALRRDAKFLRIVSSQEGVPPLSAEEVPTADSHGVPISVAEAKSEALPAAQPAAPADRMRSTPERVADSGLQPKAMMLGASPDVRGGDGTGRLWLRRWLRFQRAGLARMHPEVQSRKFQPLTHAECLSQWQKLIATFLSRRVLPARDGLITEARG